MISLISAADCADHQRIYRLILEWLEEVRCFSE